MLKLREIRKEQTASLWHKVLRLQESFTIEEDLKFLFNNSHWLNADRVLDLGCGSGDLLNYLKTFFPDKHYTGVDASPDHTRKAIARFRKSKNITIIHEDLYRFESESKFDFIVLRLVIQHLSDMPGLFKKLNSLLVPNGRILIIDAFDTMKKMKPSVAEIEKLYAQLHRSQQGARGSRRRIEQLGTLSERYDFSEELHDQTPSAAVTLSRKQAMTAIYLTVSEIVRRKFGIKINQDRLERQLKAWREEPGSYGQICMRRVLLKRAND